MSFVLLLLAAVLGLLACLGLAGLLVQWLLAAPGSDDDTLSFDPLPRLLSDRGPWVWNYLRSRFGGAPRLTYRRDKYGRFRKTGAEQQLSYSDYIRGGELNVRSPTIPAINRLA